MACPYRGVHQHNKGLQHQRTLALRPLSAMSKSMGARPSRHREGLAPWHPGKIQTVSMASLEKNSTSEEP